MKKLFIVLFFVLLLVSVVVPLLLNATCEDAIHVIDHISFIIAAFCGIITTVIAILLYDKYGVEKTVLEKNLKVVLQVIEELKKTNCFANSEGGTGGCMIKINFWTTELTEFNNANTLSGYLNDPVFFRISYAYAYNHLYELGSDPLLPQTISEKIKQLQLYMLPEYKMETMTSRYFVVSSYCDAVKEQEDRIIGKFNGKDMTLKEFVIVFIEVKKAIKQWLKAHNVADSSLNF